MEAFSYSFLFLNLFTIVKCRQVCKAWRLAIDNRIIKSNWTIANFFQVPNGEIFDLEWKELRDQILKLEIERLNEYLLEFPHVLKFKFEENLFQFLLLEIILESKSKEFKFTVFAFKTTKAILNYEKNELKSVMKYFQGAELDVSTFCFDEFAFEFKMVDPANHLFDKYVLHQCKRGYKNPEMEKYFQLEEDLKDAWIHEQFEIKILNTVQNLKMQTFKMQTFNTWKLETFLNIQKIM
jgi:hypothetical protein